MSEHLISILYNQIDIPEFERLTKIIDDRRMPLRLTDVSPRTLTSWKQKQLFDYPENVHVKLNFKEYLWIKIIQTLRDFGISLNVIHSIKEVLNQGLDIKEYHKEYEEKVISNVLSELKKSDYSDVQLRELESIFKRKGLDEILKSFSKLPDLLDLLIYILLATRSRIGILLIEENICIPWMDLFFGIDTRTNKFWQDSHLFVSFNQYLRQFLADEELVRFIEPYGLLMPQEREILDHIRNGEFKSIEIRFNDKRKPELLKLTKIHDTRERVLDILSEFDYQQIIVTKKDGKIVNLRSERTKKLTKGKNPK